jgi:hypothetical protein
MFGGSHWKFGPRTVHPIPSIYFFFNIFLFPSDSGYLNKNK